MFIRKISWLPFLLFQNLQEWLNHLQWYSGLFLLQDPKPLVLQVDLQLGVGDSVRVYDGLGERAERLLQSLSHHNNHRRALLESSQGQMSIFYHAKPHSPGHGFNATYQVSYSRLCLWPFVCFLLINDALHFSLTLPVVLEYFASVELSGVYVLACICIVMHLYCLSLRPQSFHCLHTNSQN